MDDGQSIETKQPGVVGHRQDICIKPFSHQASGEDFRRGRGTNAGEWRALYASPQQPRLSMYTAAVTYIRPEQDDVDGKFQHVAERDSGGPQRNTSWIQPHGKKIILLERVGSVWEVQAWVNEYKWV